MRELVFRELGLLPLWKRREKGICSPFVRFNLTGSGHAPCFILTSKLDHDASSLLHATLMAVGLELGKEVDLLEFDLGDSGEELQYMPLQHVRLILVLTQGEDPLPDEIFSRCGSIPRQSSYALGYLLHHPEYKVKAWHDWIRIKEGLKGCSSVV